MSRDYNECDRIIKIEGAYDCVQKIIVDQCKALNNAYAANAHEHIPLIRARIKKLKALRSELIDEVIK